MNRGSIDLRHEASEVPMRFNEAPIHESGKWRIDPTVRTRPESGFNEAPIHESGKCSSKSGESGVGRSFNEAPIHESGKYWTHRPASLRLRCFNEAPIHESGK